MTEHTEQTEAAAAALPARIQLDDFVAAVTRGVARAMAAEEDEVSGYAMRPAARPVQVGVWFPFPTTGPTFPTDPADGTVRI